MNNQFKERFFLGLFSAMLATLFIWLVCNVDWYSNNIPASIAVPQTIVLLVSFWGAIVCFVGGIVDWKSAEKSQPPKADKENTK